MAGSHHEVPGMFPDAEKACATTGCEACKQIAPRGLTQNECQLLAVKAVSDAYARSPNESPTFFTKVAAHAVYEALQQQRHPFDAKHWEEVARLNAERAEKAEQRCSELEDDRDELQRIHDEVLAQNRRKATNVGSRSLHDWARMLAGDAGAVEVGTVNLNEMVETLEGLVNDVRREFLDEERCLAPDVDLETYRLAPSGEGDRAGQWAHKPHQLVYDLVEVCAHERRLRCFAEFETTKQGHRALDAKHQAEAAIAELKRVKANIERIASSWGVLDVDEIGVEFRALAKSVVTITTRVPSCGVYGCQCQGEHHDDAQDDAPLPTDLARDSRMASKYGMRPRYEENMTEYVEKRLEDLENLIANAHCRIDRLTGEDQ